MPATAIRRFLLALAVCAGCAAADMPFELISNGKLVSAGATVHQPIGSASSSIALFSEQRDPFTIRNTGTTPITITGITITPDAGVLAEEFRLQDDAIRPAALVVSDRVLQADERLGYYVRFYPVHSGTRGAEVTISLGDGSEVSYRVQGTGRDQARFIAFGASQQELVWGGPDSDEQATGMVVLDDGSAVLLAQATGLADRFAYDLCLLRVTPAGETAWGRLWHGPFRDAARDSGQNDQTGGGAGAIARDAAGAVYFVASFSSGNSNNNFAALIVKVDANDGSILWERLWRPAWPSAMLAKHSAEGYGIDVVDGRVLVCGTTGAANSGSDSHVFLLGLDAADGSLAFQTALDPSPGSNDRGYAVRAAGPDACYIGGSGNNTGFLARIEGLSAGNPQLTWWRKLALGTGGSLNHLDVDAAGACYASCDVRGMDTRLALVKIAPDGSLAWGRSYETGASGQNNNAHALKVAGDHVFFGGRVGQPPYDTQKGDGFIARLQCADGAADWAAFYFTGKGPDEIQETRIKGLALHGRELLVFGQSYSGNSNGVRYDGYWYDATGSWKDFTPGISPVELKPEQIFSMSEGALQDATSSREWRDLPASTVLQPATDKHDGKAPDEDLVLQRILLVD